MKKKEIDFTNLLPKDKHDRRIVAEVNQELFDEAQEYMKQRKIKIKEVVEFGLKAFIRSCKK